MTTPIISTPGSGSVTIPATISSGSTVTTLNISGSIGGTTPIASTGIFASPIVKTIETVVVKDKNKLVKYFDKMEKYVLASKPLRVLCLVALGLLIIFSFRSCVDHKTSNDDVGIWKKHAASLTKQNTVLLTQNKKTLSLVDSVTKDTKKKDAQIAKLKTFSQTTTISTDSLTKQIEKDIDLSGDSVSVVPVDSLEHVVARYDGIIDSLGVALTLSTSEVKEQSIVIDSVKNDNVNLVHQNSALLASIHTAPLAKPAKFLHFFPEPSRTTAFFGGGLLGVVAAIAVIVH